MEDNLDTPVILIVEDDQGLQSQLCWHFDQYEIIAVDNRSAAVAAIKQYKPSIVLQDLGLPPEPDGVTEGMLCIEEILNIDPNCKILVMTGRSEQENALKAISLGAHDFFHKPVNTDTLDLIIERTLRVHQLEEHNRKVESQYSDCLLGVITTDPKMLEICGLIEKLAPTEITCTLLGESGVGKEVLAKALHNHSQRKNDRFMAINCASIPENLIESELFGYEKGAFSGAAKRTAGKIETANKGTLFLDEIGDMPLNLQAKLLRFLQERVIERVGGTTEIEIDTRVICATNKDLKAMSAEGLFREDLYYRICEMEINIPPLRERIGDKALLAKFFLKKYCEANNLQIKGFTSDALLAIEQYEWPGNVREMENRLKTASIMCNNKYLGADELNLQTPDGESELAISLKDTRKQAESSAITRALSMTENISAAAKLLGVSRPTLYDLMKKYEITQD
ncbi:PEP-CTERM-box response regulator transcription factor [Amphritea sp.]|uniref:PEP-CTERM-box response regulator transcription factor n=1 Tax=Amphritea sp. TaxID=1872502 RepID=UPI0025C5147A|nr:PEP-CTERM-box response regulator transcription factor [Amphritea sp.]